MMNRISGLMCLLTLGAAACGAQADVTVQGDLGTAVFHAPYPLSIGQTFTRSFTKTLLGRGTVSGDVILTNTGGSQFDMTLTNMSFQGQNAPSGVTAIQIYIDQAYIVAATNQTYTASHFVGGNWSTDQANAIFCTSIHESNNNQFVNLPALGLANQFQTSSFGVPLASASVTRGNQPVYVIHTEVDLFVANNGFIDLPNSYDLTVIADTPAPGGAALLAIGGVLVRRRRN